MALNKDKKRETKECTRCDEKKPTKDFYERDAQCKECRRERQRELYKEKRVSIKDLMESLDELRLENRGLKSEVESLNSRVRILYSTRYYPTNGHEEEVEKIAKRVSKKVVRKEIEKIFPDSQESD